MASNAETPTQRRIREAKMLEGLPARELDVDWIAIDREGHFGIFLGTDDSIARGDPEATSIAIEHIARVTAERADSGDTFAYRSAAVRPGEAVFDVPREAPGSPLHEAWFDGYPHLFTADTRETERVQELRSLMDSFGGWEVAVRDAFGVAFAEMTDPLFARIHRRFLCTGCIVAESRDDPRPRSVEVLARAGLYVYRFLGGEWIRAASPSLPVSIAAFDTMADVQLDPARLAISFEESPVARV